MRNGAEQRRTGFQPVLPRRADAPQTGWKPVLLSLAALFLLSGCSKEPYPTPPSSDPVHSQQYRQGSTLVVVSLSETNILSSGSIQLMLDVHAPAGNEVVFPEVGISVAPFAISDGYTEPPQTLPNGKQRHRRVWTLVPALPGKTIFQALEIHAGTATLLTEPIAVAVSSLLPPGLDVFEIKDIADPAPLLPEQAKRRQLWKILFAAAMGVVLPILLIRRMRKPVPIPVLPPHEAAFRSLEKLPEDPLEKIQSLTEILVAYIGGRFRLPTAGKTIPEIIPSLPKKTLLGRRYKLEKYLETSEQVRFSNRIPDGFADEFRQYVYEFVKEMTKEAACD